MQDEKRNDAGTTGTIRDFTDECWVVRERRQDRVDFLKKIEELSADNRQLIEASTMFRRRKEELRSTRDEMTGIRDLERKKRRELQESHRSFHESKENYRLLVESLPDPFIIRDGDEILFGNPAAVRLFAKESLRHLCEVPFHALISREGENRDPGMDHETMNREEEFAHQNVVVLPPGGSPVSMEMTSAPVCYHNRSATQIVLREVPGRTGGEDDLHVQIEEMERSVRALVRANRALGLVNTVTRHDVRNQLAIIRGYLGLARDCAADPALKKFLDKIDASARSIEKQILFTTDYTELGVCNSGWQQVEDVISRAREQLPSSEISFALDVQGLAIYAEHLLVKVFSNLIENSQRHEGTVDEIRVYCRKDGAALSLFYEDNGTGIPAEDKEQIFSRGFGKNTGMGLFFVRMLLQVTGISIIETGEAGKGVRFEMKVPSGSFQFVHGERPAVHEAGRKPAE
jgi:PAS domain-containing protein